ncbi:MAG TPA: hypothetical protein PKW21_03015 [Rhabdaerophilum sp.]|nr:hypothetical protein [Rhabdaerophilum sp.]
MLERIERRSRYRECLELEAQYGQFMPCEGYAHAEDLGSNETQSEQSTLLHRIVTAWLDGLHELRYTLRRS